MTVAYRISCDVGGTFTDVAVRGPGGVEVFKSPTRPDDPEEGVLQSLELAAEALTGGGLPALLGRTEAFIHSTTLGLNAVLERRSARVALIVNQGHRDILTLREGGKAEPFNLRMAYAPPLVPRADTFEIPGRISAGGEVIEPLDRAAGQEVLEQIAGLGHEAIAVCLLWSIVNAEHELALADLSRAVAPELPISLSHQVAPIIREFRRASATCIDASLKPVMRGYLDRLAARLRGEGYQGRLSAVTSAGALVSFQEAGASPVLTVNSGRSVAPVAGRSCIAVERRPSQDILVVDTGGTSFDVSVLRGGEIALTSELWLGQRFSGAFLGLPAVDVHSIGSGGGSIASVDDCGLLSVGPRSAGASPGPAAYGRGGKEPTVTDAAVAAGWIDPERFLNGRLRLDARAARTAIETGVAEPLGATVDEATSAVLALSDEQMIGAIEQVTITHGLDPRSSWLVVGGGAGGLSADRMVHRLGCPGALISPAASALSACGGLQASHATDLRQSLFTTTGEFDFANVREVVAALAGRGREFLSGAASDQASFQWFVSARYAFQVWEIEVPLSAEIVEGAVSTDASQRATALSRLRQAFHDQHRRLFAIEDPDQVIECVGWRLRVAREGQTDPIRAASLGREEHGRRPILLDDEWVEVPIISLAGLHSAQRIDGPAVVEGPAFTLVVRAGSTVSASKQGQLWLEAAERRERSAVAEAHPAGVVSGESA